MSERTLLSIAAEYDRKGWLPFPLPPGRKFPPPKGVPSYIEKYSKYNWKWDDGNIGLAMPENVVGIDVDSYKEGNELPVDLPPTYCSTSRLDGSGIYYYKVPPGTRFQGSIEGVGETVQWFHRYAVCSPSVHPEGDMYTWFDMRDNECSIPNIEDLPDLPDAWLKKLELKVSRDYSRGYNGNVQDWLDGLRIGPVNGQARLALNTFRRDMRHGCRYDAMVKATSRLVGLGANKHRGIDGALQAVQDEYLVAMASDPRTDGDSPAAEFARALAGAIAKFGGRL